MKENDVAYKVRGAVFAVHKKQLQTYLKLAHKRLGLLINFNTVSIDRNSFIREVNGLW